MNTPQSILQFAGVCPAAKCSRDFMRFAGACDSSLAHGRQNAGLNGRNQR